MIDVLYVLYAIVVIGVIVFFHEMGHFLAARACNIAVEEFSMGFGPSILSKKGKKTLYSIRLLPLGGYCRFVDEFREDESSDGSDKTSTSFSADEAFNRQSVFKRIIVTFSGPFMNFVLAYIAIVIYLMFVGFGISAPVVYDVVDGMNAQKAGIQAGDVITKIGDEEIAFDQSGAERLSEIIRSSDGETAMTFTVNRGEETLLVDVIAQKVAEGMQIGISMGAYQVYLPLGQALMQGMDSLKSIFLMMVDLLRNMFTTGEGIEDTTGIVGAVSIMSTGLRQGFDMMLNMIVVISLNLGIMNLLPVPGLDGGRLLFLVIEAIRRKPIKPEHEGWIHAAGIIAIMALMVVLTYRDIARIITGAFK